jgi:hypothetical protein
MRFVRIVAVVALIAGAAGVSGAGAAGPRWRVQTVKAHAGSTDNDLRAVSCSSSTSCDAIGILIANFTTGGPVAAGWDGTRWWLPRTAASTPTNPMGISCVSSTQCTAAGSNFDNATFAYKPSVGTWNGTKWTGKTVPVPASATGGGILNAVSCPSATACLAVGSAFGTGTAPLADSWNGTKWKLGKPVLPDSSPAAEFWGVSCTAATACIAVGESFLSGGSDSVAMAQAWNGTAWTTQLVPAPASSFLAQFDGVSCTPSPVSCTAVGRYRSGSTSGPITPLIEHWDGSTWAVQTPASSIGVLWGVSCSSATACVAVGGGGTNNNAFAEHWNGVSWTAGNVVVPVGTGNGNLTGVSCTAANECTAVGSDYTTGDGHLHTLVERFS